MGRGGENVPPRMTLWDLFRSERFRFAAAFGLSCLGFHAAICALDHYPIFFSAVCEYTALSMGQVLNAFGMSVAISRNVVSGHGLTFAIVLECTPLLAMGLFACFASFYPAAARKKIIGLAAGLPVLYLGNLARLVLIFVVSWHKPTFFNIAHVYLGQVFTMLLVVLTCLVWLKWVHTGFSYSPSHRVAAFLGRFVIISGCLFLFWIEFHHWYIRLLDWFMTLGFSFFGRRIFFPPLADVYYETFSIVTFSSLIIASRSVKWRKKAKGLAAGMALFFFLHLFHRVDNALVRAFHYTSLFEVDVFLCDVGQYALPILLWLAVAVRRPSGKNKSRESSRLSPVLP